MKLSKKAAKLLEDAEALLSVEGGWCRQRYESLGAHCAVGALNKACSDNAYEYTRGDRGPRPYTDALRALAGAIGRERGDSDVSVIIAFNDSHRTLKRDVIAAFRQARGVAA